MPLGKTYFRLQLENSGTSISWPILYGWRFPVPPSALHLQEHFTVTVDPNLNQLLLVWEGSKMLVHYVAGNWPIVVKTTPLPPHGSVPAVSVVGLPTPPSTFGLCRSLIQGH